ncbi:hypothetical protein SALBM217S_05734 [Streptomyces griseoloalbus]
MSGLEAKVFVLPDETWIYPGHGNDTTLGAERPHLGEWHERLSPGTCPLSRHTRPVRGPGRAQASPMTRPSMVCFCVTGRSSSTTSQSRWRRTRSGKLSQ